MYKSFVDLASVKQILNTSGIDSINGNILGKQPIFKFDS